MSNYYEERDAKYEASRKRKQRFITGGALAGVILLIALIFVISSLEKINAGYAGVVYSFRGGIEDKTLTQGLKWVGPFKKVTEYTVATEQGYMSKDKKEGSKDDDSFNVPTKSGKMVNVDMEYSFRFDAERLPLVYTKFRGQSGKDIEELFMRGKLKSWAAEVTSQFEVLDIYGEKRSSLNEAATKHLKERFDEYGIIIESVNFSRIQLDAETEKAIQDRIAAQQKLETIKTEKLLAEQNAEKAKIEAEGKAKSDLIAAEGAAKVKLAQAQGEADANAKLQASLTEKLVEYKKLEVMEKQAEAMAKWNVNTLIQGQGTNPIVNIPAVTPSK